MAAAIVAVIAAALAACGANTPAAPKLQGGAYTSAAYHFTVAYPDGWKANETSGDQASTTIPLSVVITRTGAVHTEGGPISSFTVTVLNARDPTIAGSIAALQAQAKGPNTVLKPVTLAGHPALQDIPTTPQVPGAPAVTHTDYFLVVGDYEYEVATDAVAGDKAEPELQAMLQSFAVTA